MLAKHFQEGDLFLNTNGHLSCVYRVRASQVDVINYNGSVYSINKTCKNEYEYFSNEPEDLAEFYRDFPDDRKEIHNVKHALVHVNHLILSVEKEAESILKGYAIKSQYEKDMFFRCLEGYGIVDNILPSSIEFHKRRVLVSSHGLPVYTLEVVDDSEIKHPQITYRIKDVANQTGHLEFFSSFDSFIDHFERELAEQDLAEEIGEIPKEEKEPFKKAFLNYLFVNDNVCGDKFKTLLLDSGVSPKFRDKCLEAYFTIKGNVITALAEVDKHFREFEIHLASLETIQELEELYRKGVISKELFLSSGYRMNNVRKSCGQLPFIVRVPDSSICQYPLTVEEAYPAIKDVRIKLPNTELPRMRGDIPQIYLKC